MALETALVKLLLVNMCSNYNNTGFNNATLPGTEEEIGCILKEKLPLEGKVLKIVTLKQPPFSDVVDGRPGGIVFEFVDMLGKKFGFKYNAYIPEENGLGDKRSGILGELHNGKADMAAALLPVFHDRVDLADYSTNLDESNWIVMLRRPSESASGAGLLAPFDGTVWICTLISLILIGPIIYCIIIIRSKLCRGDETLAHTYSVGACVWFTYGGLMKQGSTLLPVADSTRMLFATWWIFITILTSFYTANLTAFLTLRRFTLPIEGPRDITRTKSQWVAHKGTALEHICEVREDYAYLNKTVHDGKGRFMDSSDEEMLALVEQKKVPFLSEKRLAEYWMYQDYLKKAHDDVPEDDRCTLVITPQVFMIHSIAFAFPKNSTFTKMFDPVFLSLVESGIIRHLLQKKMPSTKICPLDLGNSDIQMKNGDFFMTYLTVILGYSVAVVSFIGEVIYKQVKQCGQKTKVTTDNGTGWTKNEGNKSQLFPPPYSVILGQNIMGTQKKINGRDYLVVNSTTGDTQLIPVRAPSAFLFQYAA